MALFIYYIAMIWLHWDDGSKWLIFQPVYSLFVSLIVVPIGILYYFVMAIPERNFGFIRVKRKAQALTSSPQSFSTNLDRNVDIVNTSHVLSQL